MNTKREQRLVVLLLGAVLGFVLALALTAVWLGPAVVRIRADMVTLRARTEAVQADCARVMPRTEGGKSR